MGEYSNFVRSNQILPQKVDFWGKKVAFYSNWRSNQEWPSNRVNTVYQQHAVLCEPAIVLVL